LDAFFGTHPKKEKEFQKKVSKKRGTHPKNVIYGKKYLYSAKKEYKKRNFTGKIISS